LWMGVKISSVLAFRFFGEAKSKPSKLEQRSIK
jgi:hypothetical protein